MLMFLSMSGSPMAQVSPLFSVQGNSSQLNQFKSSVMSQHTGVG